MNHLYSYAMARRDSDRCLAAYRCRRAQRLDLHNMHNTFTLFSALLAVGTLFASHTFA
jgi:hypothetical protein